MAAVNLIHVNIGILCKYFVDLEHSNFPYIEVVKCLDYCERPFPYSMRRRT